MQILFTLCGRAGSKGIKNKNCRIFLGKYLAYYSLSVISLFLKEHRQEYKADIVVNTDSAELVDIMNRNSMESVEIIQRRDSLAGDTVGKVEVILDCLQQMEKRSKKYYDIVVDLDITSPLRTVKNLHSLLETHKNTGADVTTSVTTARRNPYFNQLKKTEKGYTKVIESTYTARQQAPEIYDMNASLYAYKPDFLRQGKGVLEGYVECILMQDTGVLDLDHESDFTLMEVIAKYLIEQNKEFCEVFENIR